ncbi:hypothetical protein BT69DRAFT_1229374 [Atractiella rhizophila]|nr:hypothetical protein BT69DRAFT_1229374 [Atractiella rhizophila]
MGGRDEPEAVGKKKVAGGIEKPELRVVEEKKDKDEDVEIDEENILANVEEMLEGFEWRNAGSSKGKGGAGSSDQIERRLLRELKALEEASIFAIIESDERVAAVVKDLDEAIAELDRMDQMISLYKTQLLTMSDDINHIEGQNRGLQVQTSNQRALVAELDRLLSTVNIPAEDLTILKKEPMESTQSIQRLETSAATLYKALLSTRDMGVGDMVVANERLAEYRERASQFCVRVLEFLAVMFKFQIDLMEKDSSRAIDKNKPSLPTHAKLEEYLGRYCGLMLFVKEVDYQRFQQICSAYYTAASDLHRKEMTELFAAYRKLSRKPTEDEQEASFTYQSVNAPTVLNKSAAGRKTKIGDVNKGGMPAHQTFSKLVEVIVKQIETEQAFIADFLHTFSSPLDPLMTFADYMDLESYFKQGAAAAMTGQQARFKDIRQSLDMIFGFMVTEFTTWIDSEIAKDGFQIVGILAVLDRAAARAESRRNDFLARVMQKQHQKASGLLEKICKEQIKAIEQTKLTLKKRKGVVPFMRVFPRFVDRIESQVLPSDDRLPTRKLVNDVYDRIVSSMLESLQQMAKMDGDAGAGEDSKDQLNYHVILIENMHHFLTTIGPKKIAPLKPSLDRARDLYDQNLNLYIKVVLRRPLSRLLDFFSGMEQLLRTTPANEVSLHGAYTKSSLKKTISSFDYKDLKKGMEALSKRIDKHFGDISNPSAENSEAVRTVWKACEEEMTRLIKEWAALIVRCFPDDKVAFDFGVEEVQSVFKKNVPQSAGSMS